MSISQCQYQFKHRRWNCSAQSPENVFGKIVKIGKDSSFQTLGEHFSLSLTDCPFLIFPSVFMLVKTLKLVARVRTP